MLDDPLNTFEVGLEYFRADSILVKSARESLDRLKESDESLR